MTESEMIDAMLEFYALRPEKFKVDIDNDLRSTHTKALQKMIAYNLIETRGKLGFHFLTQKGYEAYKSGGFDSWLFSTEKREVEAHQATLDSARATVDAARSSRQSKNAAWFSGIFGAVAVTITVYQLWKGSETDNKINALTKQVTSVDSLMNAPQRSLITIEQKEHRSSVNSSIWPTAPVSASRVTEYSPPEESNSPTK